MTDLLYRQNRTSDRRRRQRWPSGELLEHRGVIASSIALGALVAGATAGGAVASGAIASHAAGSAADKQTAAANHAADLSKQSADEALAFQKQQAAQDAARYEAAQRGNYNQYVSKVKGAQSLGNTIGFSLPDAAPYVSSTGANDVGGSASGGDPKVAAFIADYQKSHPVSEGIGPIADALQKAGLSSGRFDYGDGKLSNNEVTVGGQPYKVLGGEGTKAAYWYVPGTNDSAPAGIPGNIGSYLPTTNYAAYAPPVQPFHLNTINAFLKQ